MAVNWHLSIAQTEKDALIGLACTLTKVSNRLPLQCLMQCLARHIALLFPQAMNLGESVASLCLAIF